MSHFTCLVIGPDHEEQLAPYDENESVEPYKAYWDSAEIEIHERYLIEQGKLTGEPTLEELVAAYNAFYKITEGDEDGEGYVYMDDGGAYQWSRFNPRSKWDWYEIGGRWTGFFKLKKKVRGKVSLGSPGLFGNAPKHEADQCLVGDVDLGWMRGNAGLRAGAVWDDVYRVIADLPKALGWEHYIGLIKLAEAGEGEYTIEQVREDYHAQPRVKALKEWNDTLPDAKKVLGWNGPGVEEFQVSREAFVQRARDEAVCPYAYVMNGEWHAPGKMGWFGSSTDTESDRVHFAREFNELLDSLPDDTELTLLDLHI